METATKGVAKTKLWTAGKLLGSALLLALLTTSAIALGSTIGVVKTTTVSGPCNGVAYLPDVNRTTTYIGSCTGTITYTSQSTSIGPNHTQLVDHVYSQALGCLPLTIATGIVRWDTTPLPMSGDSWQLVFIMSDYLHNYTDIAAFTTINGAHNVTNTVMKAGVVVSHVTRPILSTVAFPGDFKDQEFTDFYSDGDGMQFFWYAPHAAAIQWTGTVNLPLLSPAFTPSDVVMFLAPLAIGTPLNFSPFSLGYFYVGQQGGAPGTVPVTTSVNTSPCATPVSTALSTVTPINVGETVTTIGAYDALLNVGTTTAP